MKKKVSLNVLLKSGFWYTASNFLTRAMAFLTMPLFTRLLSKEEYGDYSLYANWQAMLLIICGLEVYSTINRARFDFDKDGELDGYISSSLILSTLFTGVVFVLYLIFPNLFERFFLIDRRYMMIMFAYLFTYPAFMMFHAKQQTQYRYKLSSTITFFILIASCVFSVALTLTLNTDRLLGRILGQYSLYIAAGILFYVYFICRSRKITFGAWKYALKLGLPMVFAYLGSQVLLSADSVIVKHLCSSEMVSYLSLTHSCSQIVLLLVQSVNSAWAPWFFDMLKSGYLNQIRKVFQVYIWLIVAGTFAVILVGPEIILILGGENYHESVYILPAYILCGVFTVLTSQLSNLETYYKKTKYAAIFTAAAAALNIVLDIIGVKLWGYRAACYATLICQLLLVGLHYRFTLKMDIREILPLKNLLLIVAAGLLLIPVALVLYQNDLIRYLCICLLVVCACIGLIVKRNDVKQLILKLRAKD